MPTKPKTPAWVRGLQRIADWLLIHALDTDAPWCVVIAAQGRETSVQAELALAGWSTYLPMQTCWKGDRERRKMVNRPLFSRYLFAACNPGGDQAAGASEAMALAGLVTIRRSSTGRSIVSPLLMAKLMRAEANHGFDLTYEKPKPQKKSFVNGQPVHIRAGVLGGHDAMILKVLSDRYVIARYTLFGREGEAKFESADLEAAEPAEPRQSAA